MLAAGLTKLGNVTVHCEEYAGKGPQVISAEYAKVQVRMFNAKKQ